MRFTKNYFDPVCDTCACGRWSKRGTQTCDALKLTVREEGRITNNFAACYGAFYVKEGER